MRWRSWTDANGYTYDHCRPCAHRYGSTYSHGYATTNTHNPAYTTDGRPLEPPGGPSGLFELMWEFFERNARP